MDIPNADSDHTRLQYGTSQHQSKRLDGPGEEKLNTQEASYCLAIKDIAAVARSDLPLKRILNSIARRTSRVMQVAGCAIMLLDPQKEFIIPTGSYGLSDLYLRKGSLRAHRSIPAILDGKVITIADASKDSRIEYPQAARDEGIVSVLGVPVFGKDGVAGELRIYTHERRRFSPFDRDFANAVAAVAALVIEKEAMRQPSSQTPALMPQTTTQSARQTISKLRHQSFAHPSEAEFARLLNFYRIDWLYEPRSFPIKRDGSRITEMFTPDFYLPEMDLYIELTTMKQRLITEKNRKIRLLRQLYPDIKIRLLNQSDYAKLLAKYGYGPLAAAKVQGISRVLFNHTQIQRRVNAIAKRISKDYAGRELVLVGVLKGVLCFMSDLMQKISLPVAVDFMGVSYFADAAGETVTITKELDISIKNKDVLMVEDIVDTGMTLNYLLEYLAGQEPASMRVCTLLDKQIRRITDVKLDYVGFEVADEFVVGYGLDYRGQYRNLPFIGTLGPTPMPKYE
ncbi:MAG: hypoxanthine phosphoribosyltransferase [Chloroflexota bacterium]